MTYLAVLKSALSNVLRVLEPDVNDFENTLVFEYIIPSEAYSIISPVTVKLPST